MTSATLVLIQPLLLFALLTLTSEVQADSPPDRWRSLHTVRRAIPDAGDHPGNVHVLGEEVRIRVPPEVEAAGKVRRWRLIDDRDRVVAAGELDRKKLSPISVGKPGIGWYRLEFLDGESRQVGWTTAVVLAPLRQPTPKDSPICVDGAVSWFAREDQKKQGDFARLAALAGVNWIRDRLKWAEIQPAQNRFVGSTTYDTAAIEETRHGLKILQVFHDTPVWAAEESTKRGRFPPDLRAVFRLCRELARRFKGRVLAWEPWNEANIRDFGGHTVDAICSYQKAAYLGFKAGDPAVTVCWNAQAGIQTRLHARGVIENEAWPYFETYNIHTYDWPHAYADLWEFARDAASGRPLWVTESDRGLQYATGRPWYDLSRRGERLKAEFMAQSYAQSLFAGSQRHFHFILGHYYETRNKVQFGLLRNDLTPRPAYSALAALGRFLAGARCLGRVRFEKTPEVTAISFRAKPDGVIRDVLVVWIEKRVDWPGRGVASADWPLPANLRIEGVFDYLGRKLGPAPPARLTSAPLFVVLPVGECDKLPSTPPRPSVWRGGAPSPVVFQLHMPHSTVKDVAQRKWAQEYHYLIPREDVVTSSLSVYNLGVEAVRGGLGVVHLPEGWTIEPREWDLALAPMERASLQVRIDRPAESGNRKSDTWIKLRGDFGAAGRPVLSFRLISAPSEGYDR